MVWYRMKMKLISLLLSQLNRIFGHRYSFRLMTFTKSVRYTVINIKVAVIIDEEDKRKEEKEKNLFDDDTRSLTF